MFKKTLISLLMISTFSLTACDKIKAMTEKTVACNDPAVLDSIEATLQKQILAETKNYLQYTDVNTDVGLIKQAVSHLKMSVDDIGNPQKAPDSSKNLCNATLVIGLNNELLQRAEANRKANGELPIQDFAFRQDVDLMGNQLQKAVTYSTQPTTTPDKPTVELTNVADLQTFVAKIIVDASQQPNSMNQATKIASTVASTSIVASAVIAPAPGVASAPTNPNTATPNPSTVGPAGQARAEADKVDNHQAEFDSQAVSKAEMLKLAKEKAKAQAQVDFKRKEFNQLWNSASPDAQALLTDDQKQWVADRDEACISEAQEAEPAEQETVRLQCVARKLGERYYEVKEYFDNYE